MVGGRSGRSLRGEDDDDSFTLNAWEGRDGRTREMKIASNIDICNEDFIWMKMGRYYEFLLVSKQAALWEYLPMNLHKATLRLRGTGLWESFKFAKQDVKHFNRVLNQLEFDHTHNMRRTYSQMRTNRCIGTWQGFSNSECLQAMGILSLL